jgi:hypothetical protein
MPTDLAACLCDGSINGEVVVSKVTDGSTDVELCAGAVRGGRCNCIWRWTDAYMSDGEGLQLVRARQGKSALTCRFDAAVCSSLDHFVVVFLPFALWRNPYGSESLGFRRMHVLDVLLGIRM